MKIHHFACYCLVKAALVLGISQNSHGDEPCCPIVDCSQADCQDCSGCGGWEPWYDVCSWHLGAVGTTGFHYEFVNMVGNANLHNEEAGDPLPFEDPIQFSYVVETKWVTTGSIQGGYSPWVMFGLSVAEWNGHTVILTANETARCNTPGCRAPLLPAYIRRMYKQRFETRRRQVLVDGDCEYTTNGRVCINPEYADVICHCNSFGRRSVVAIGDAAPVIKTLTMPTYEPEPMTVSELCGD